MNVSQKSFIIISQEVIERKTQPKNYTRKVMPRKSLRMADILLPKIGIARSDKPGGIFIDPATHMLPWRKLCRQP